MRGEEVVSALYALADEGSPPRARGRDVGWYIFPAGVGITPACAGKSTPWGKRVTPERDHPRVRGEENDEMTTEEDEEGSPPRARGRGRAPPCTSSPSGITPACAGKSTARRLCRLASPDHPRVRGEEWKVNFPVGKTEGSPPRARGRVHGLVCHGAATGITPACAGKRQC